MNGLVSLFGGADTLISGSSLIPAQSASGLLREPLEWRGALNPVYVARGNDSTLVVLAYPDLPAKWMILRLNETEDGYKVIELKITSLSDQRQGGVQ